MSARKCSGVTGEIQHPASRIPCARVTTCHHPSVKLTRGPVPALLGLVVTICLWLATQELTGGGLANHRQAADRPALRLAQWAEAETSFIARSVATTGWPTLFPHRGLGDPLGSRAYALCLHPLALPALLGEGDPAALLWTQIVALLTAGLGALLFAHGRGAGAYGAFATGVLYALAGPVVAAIHQPLGLGAAALPWFLILAGGWQRSANPPLWLAALASFYAVVLGGGIALGGVALIALASLRSGRQPGLRERRALLWLGLAAATLCSSWVWIPALAIAPATITGPAELASLFGPVTTTTGIVTAALAVALAAIRDRRSTVLAVGGLALATAIGSQTLAIGPWLAIASLAGTAIDHGRRPAWPLLGLLLALATAALVGAAAPVPPSPSNHSWFRELRVDRSVRGGRLFSSTDRPTPLDCVEHGFWDAGAPTHHWTNYLGPAFAKHPEAVLNLLSVRNRVRSNATGEAELMPRKPPRLAWFPRRIEAADRAEAAWKGLVAAGLDARATAWIEAADPTIRVAPRAGTAIRSDGAPGELELRVQATQPGYLLVSIGQHAALRAELDGRALAVLRANGLFVALLVPPGRHRLRLYALADPTGLALWVSPLGLLLLVTLLASILRNPRFRSGPVDHFDSGRQDTAPLVSSDRQVSWWL